MLQRVTVITLCVCVCVCPPFSGIKHLYNTLNMAIGFALNAKDFQLMNFSEKASFKSYRQLETRKVGTGTETENWERS